MSLNLPTVKNTLIRKEIVVNDRIENLILVEYKEPNLVFHFDSGEVLINSKLIQNFNVNNYSLLVPDLIAGVYGDENWMSCLNRLKFKGFQGVWDGYHGTVILDKDVVTFCGETLDLAYTAFVESIEDYLEFKDELLSVK